MVTNNAPILAPVDFSPAAEAALIWGSRVAGALRAPLVVLHVAHDPIATPGVYVRADETGAARPLTEVADELLQEFMERVRSRHPDCAALREASVRLISGLPVTRILEVADEIDAQLIVMGHRGLTRLEHLMLGSQVERVLHLSPRPVVVVKAEPAA